MLNHRTGDLLESGVDYICHQVNCQGRMGSGIAKQIKERWPIVYEEYMAEFQKREKEIAEMCGGFEYQLDVGETLLGHIQVIPVNHKQNVINLFAQQYYGYDGKRYTSYDAFYNCLERMARIIPKNATIAFPYKIGCDRGGADWDIISKMIERVLGDFNVTIYHLEDRIW